MATTAGEKRLFVDTNILAYISLVNSPFHLAAQNKLNDFLQQGFELWISRQIIREYLVVMSRALAEQGAFDAAQLVADTEKLTAQFSIADDTDLVSTQLFQLIVKYKVQGKPVHDCNIVAAMQVNGISHLLTNNEADFKRYDEGITVVSLK
jgi:predicted nucleic acid-binding protein